MRLRFRLSTLLLAVAAVAVLIAMRHVVALVLVVVVHILVMVAQILIATVVLAAWLAIPVGFLYAVDRLVLAIERRETPDGRRARITPRWAGSAAAPPVPLQEDRAGWSAEP